MNKKTTILGTLRNAIQNKRSSYDKRIVHPVREWVIGLCVFFFVVIAGGVQSAQLFVTYQTISTKDGTYEEQLPKYNELLIRNVIEKYRTRAGTFDALKQEIVPAQTAVVEQPVSTSTAEAAEPAPEDGTASPQGDVILVN